MEAAEYLRLLTEQIRCRRARGPVADEIRAHIGDQAAAYEEEGMERETALVNAVLSMGDPVETGTALDRIHRPRMDWKFIVLIAALSLAGILLQFVLSRTLSGESVIPFSRFITFTAIGLLCMVLFCLIDYTILGKHPFALYLTLAVLIFLADRWGTKVNGNSRTQGLILLLIPLYAGIVWHYRTKGGRGIVLCLLWLALPCLLLNTLRPHLSSYIMVILSGLLLLTFAMSRKITGSSDRTAVRSRAHRHLLPILTLWGAAALLFLGAFWFLLSFGADYQRFRITHLIPANPADPSIGVSSLYNTIHEILSGLTFTGRPGSRPESPFVHVTGIQGNYFLLWLMGSFGMLAGIVLITGLALFFIRMFRMAFREKNRLGALTGFACTVSLSLCCLFHVLLNLAYLPTAGVYLPFFSSDGRMILAAYSILGLFLSVYRNSNVVTDPIHPKSTTASLSPRIRPEG